MSELTREKLSNFCGNLQYRLQLLTKTRQHTDRLLATRFNVFEYIEPGENKLSDLIADLIDPHGKHGQGDAFLREFVSTVCGPVGSTWKFRFIRREDTTAFIEKSQRRLDILIDLESLGIAIENKPWAAEQDQQIHDYVAHLKLRFAGQYIIVYLSPDGGPPTSINSALVEQLLRERRLILCAYSGLFHDWLTRCYQICTAEKVRWFLFDFMTYAEQTFPLGLLAMKRPENE